MKAETIVSKLKQCGVKLSIEGDDLILDGPVEVLTNETLESLRPYKPVLIELLRQRKRGLSVRAHRMPAECLLDTCDGKLAQIGVDTWHCQTCGGQWRLVGSDPGFEDKPAARPVPTQNRNLTVSELPVECPACASVVDLQDKVTTWCPTCRVFILMETIQ